MEGKNLDMKESLEGAIYREIGARDFYAHIADKIDNEKGRKRFAQLSIDEDGHRAQLESWFSKLFGEEFVASVDRLKDSEIKGFDVSERTSAMEALDIAIEAESKASDFYSSKAGQTDDAELKKLFLELAEVEKGHYDLLNAERNQLAGGFYWFDMDSSSFMEE